MVVGKIWSLVVAERTRNKLGLAILHLDIEIVVFLKNPSTGDERLLFSLPNQEGSFV